MKSIIESAQPIIDVVQESENELRDLVPQSLTLVRGKSASQRQVSHKEKVVNGPPSFAKPITTELSPRTGMRSIKYKYGTSSRAKSVTPMRSSLSYKTTSGEVSYYGDHNKSSRLQNSDKKSVSAYSYHKNSSKK